MKQAAAKKRGARSAHFRQVWVATDFTPGARSAAGRAALLPIAPGGRIVLVHVVPAHLPASVRSTIERAIRVELNKEAERLLPILAGRGLGRVKVVTRLFRGDPYLEIIRNARSSRADLIVLGRHGESRRSGTLFLGSTADRVIRKGDIPVLVVVKKPVRAYRRVTAALDLADTSGRVLDLASQAIEGAPSEAIALHVAKLPFEDILAAGVRGSDLRTLRAELRAKVLPRLESLAAEGSSNTITWQVLVRHGEPRSEILRVAAARRSELIAVGTQGRTGITHILLGSVAQSVLHSATCDVLVTRPSRTAFRLP